MFSKTNKLLIKWLLKLEKNNVSKILITSFVGVLLFVFNSTLIAAPKVIEKTLAIVNSEPIFLSDMKDLDSRLQKSSMIDDLLLLDMTLDSLKKNDQHKLQFLINEKLIDTEVKRQNLAVTMERVDQEIRDLAKRNNMKKDELLINVRQQGITESEFQSFQKQRIERQSVVEQEVTSKIRLSDDDILAFYASSTGKKVSKIVEYTLAHIFFSPQKGSAKDALERAKNVLLQIKDGKTFDSLLHKNTEELNPSNNGLLGTFKTGEFSNEMESSVRDLEVGGVSEVVKSRTGFHILKVVSKKLVTDPEFEKNKERYRAQLFENVFRRQFKNWLEQKRDEANIKIN